MRPFNPITFDRAYKDHILTATWNEPKEYYPRYRPRYEGMLRELATVAPEGPLDVLEIGGGQLALLSRELWGDRAVVADLPGPHFHHLEARGVDTAQWNLLDDDPPFVDQFDLVIFSEVIEHLPIPGHLVLEKIRGTMRRGAKLLVSTPNLHRPRNLVYLALGKQIFDHFRYPNGHGLGHVLEYSSDHLKFQLEQAGFTDCRVELKQFWHVPESLPRRVLGWVGAPMRLIPHFRDNLVGFGTAR
jgi:SAM-dependent methyltransferase